MHERFIGFSDRTRDFNANPDFNPSVLEQNFDLVDLNIQPDVCQTGFMGRNRLED